MTQHSLKDITFVHCTEKPHVFHLKLVSLFLSILHNVKEPLGWFLSRMPCFENFLIQSWFKIKGKKVWVVLYCRFQVAVYNRLNGQIFLSFKLPNTELICIQISKIRYFDQLPWFTSTILCLLFVYNRQNILQIFPIFNLLSPRLMFSQKAKLWIFNGW